MGGEKASILSKTLLLAEEMTGLFWHFNARTNTLAIKSTLQIELARQLLIQKPFPLSLQAPQ